MKSRNLGRKCSFIAFFGFVFTLQTTIEDSEYKKITIQDTILIILIDNVSVKMSRLGKISKTNLDISFSRKAGKNTYRHFHTLILFHSHTTCSDEVPAC